MPSQGQPLGALLIVASIFGFAWAFHVVTITPMPLPSRAVQAWSAFAHGAADVPEFQVEPGAVRPSVPTVITTGIVPVIVLGAPTDHPAPLGAVSGIRTVPAVTEETVLLSAHAWAPAELPASIAPGAVVETSGGPAHTVSKAFARTGSAIGLAFRKTSAGLKTAF